jgi:hypothetical protein
VVHALTEGKGGSHAAHLTRNSLRQSKEAKADHRPFVADEL